MNLWKILIFSLVVLIGIFLRFHQLDMIPAGLYTDEAAQGYDAYSFLLTGKDQYGKSFPIFLRSFGDFKSPLYTYLTILPVYFFDLSAFSTRFISALSGVVIIAVTFFLLKKNFLLALTTAFIIAISPWSILFSRHALEANLALALVVVSIFLFNLSKEKNFYIIPACLFLGISTYAYHAERLFSFVFLFCFIWFSKKDLTSKWLFIGIILFLIIQIPQFSLIGTRAFNIRINQLNYWTNDFFIDNGGGLRNFPLGQQLFITREFFSQFLAFFSPKNLFFQPDSQTVRSIPDLSVFFSWMFLPFLVGIKAIWKIRQNPQVKIVILTILISPVPAALTKDPFYTLRALPLFWGLTVVIALGFLEIIYNLPNLMLKISAFSVITAASFLSLYSSYFVLFKYERSNDYGYPFIELVKKTNEYSSQQFTVDTGRRFATYIYFAFYNKYDPKKIQTSTDSVTLDSYYNNTAFAEQYKIENVIIKPIVWDKDIERKGILVGDPLAISDEQITEHKLTPAFEIQDLASIVRFKAYYTHPEFNSRMKI